MEQLKNTGDKFFHEQNYEEANKYYTKALDVESEDKYKIYLNRCLSFYKQKKYDEALSDAIKATRLNPDNAKSWGRLGSCLNVLGRKQQAVCAFKKAYELEPTNENYKKEAEAEEKSKKEKESELNNSDTEDEDSENNDNDDNEDDSTFQQEILSLTKNLKSMNFASMPNIDLLNNKTVDNMLNNMLSNKELINKLSDQSFQNRILSYQNNPFEALKDKEAMSLMCSILQDFTEIK
jgi:tetratricopeptide (TPR) repeat protein